MDLDDVSSVLHGSEEPAPTAPETATQPRRRGRPPKSATSGQPTPKTSPTPRAEIPMPPAGVLAEGVSGMYAFVGMGLMPFRPQTAVTVVKQADELGKAWEALAAANPAVRRALLGLMQTSAVGAVVAAHIPIALALMAEQRELKSAAEEAIHPQPVRIAPENRAGTGTQD